MKYAKARYEDYREEFIYKVYMTDSINLIPDQAKLVDKFIDLLNPKIVDTRSGDEIAMEVIQNLGLRMKNECI